MIWRRVPKELSIAPQTGDYSQWKAQLALEAEHQCVYCAIHEACFGGQRNYHVEHYRPKSKYPGLTNSYANLFYACAICNAYKGDDWPGEPNKNLDTIHYPDPSHIDYSTLFEVDWTIGTVLGRVASSIYMAERLFLNRPQLTIERRTAAHRQHLREFIETTNNLIAQARELPAGAKRVRALELSSRLAEHLCNLLHAEVFYFSTSPYTEADVSRH